MKMLEIIQRYQKDITAKYPESFELLDQILHFAQFELMDKLEKFKFTSEDDYRHLYVSFFARAIKNGISIFTLCSQGLNEDTSILLRALIEQVGYTYFIATLEDKGKVFERFTHHEYCRVYKFRNQIKDVMPEMPQFPDDGVEAKREEYQNKFHNNDLCWTGVTTTEMLKDLITKFPNKGFDYMYLDWAFLSSYVHSSQRSFKSIVQPELTISTAPDLSQLPDDLIWTANYLLYIFHLINSEFGLGFDTSLQKFRDSIDNILKK